VNPQSLFWCFDRWMGPLNLKTGTVPAALILNFR
jgi:hypothetical protein